ncbi:hypothetical protein JQC67_08420 [Aurantibacter crassamenti]|uniref:hypothetical protein n=1 Tax=Aurantibacter crassamenti TaxID=1837375 RepID=UPI0019398528|nr:hypothetical protein [Aurantibacter crassamenti]MBM1106157.1 hypothetical protein [Aurantibacter crassamenti]
MKKILVVSLIFASTLIMSSCDYDDSEDIDVLTPNDNPESIIENPTLKIDKTRKYAGFIIFQLNYFIFYLLR